MQNSIFLVTRYLCVFLAFLLYSSLFAQAPPDLSSEQVELLRRKGQEEREALRRFQEQGRDAVPPSKPNLESQKEIPIPKFRSKKGRKCMPIQNIYIVGDSDLSDETIYELVKDWQGYCLGSEDFAALLRKVTKYYAEKGYISTRAYLTPQDLKGGNLEIRVIPGIVGNIRFAEGQGYASEIFTAFPLLKGSHLYLRSLEQGIEHYLTPQDLKGGNLEIRVIPGIVGNIRFAEGQGYASEIFTAFPLLKGS